jgi:site-specific recombinase XerD
LSSLNSGTAESGRTASNSFSAAHPVVIPGSGTRSWTVLRDDVPVVPVDRFLAYLTDIGRSPNTVKAYSHDLKDCWEFLSFRGLDWREARLEDVGEFVAWLQLPPAGRSGPGRAVGRGRGAAVGGSGDGIGCRAGEALGLRREDIAAAECDISIVARENVNGARAKSGSRTIPAGPDLIRLRLYADYLHEEYGASLSDYVFINIWAGPRGQAWSYHAAYDLVLRLRARTRIAFDPHWFRHSAATRWLRDGVPIEVVSTLLGHSSVAVTSSVYGHLTAEDARAALEKAGWFTGKEVQW